MLMKPSLHVILDFSATEILQKGCGGFESVEFIEIERGDFGIIYNKLLLVFMRQLTSVKQVRHPYF